MKNYLCSNLLAIVETVSNENMVCALGSIEMISHTKRHCSDVEISHFVFEGRFGAVHRVVGERHRRAVIVLCPPLGRDWRSLYRSNYEWANMLARNGFPVVRFDQRGTGDSGETPAGADAWSEWISGISAIAHFARETTGAETLCLAGFRLGGLLAGCSAEAIHANYLMLLAPYVNGAIWLRELQLEAAIRGKNVGRDGEFNGIILDPASEPAIAAAKMPDQLPSVRGAFVAAANSVSWAPWLEGITRTTQPFPSWNTFFRDSHVITPPWDVLHAATDWICRQVEIATGVPGLLAIPGGAVSLHGDDWVEMPIMFGSGLRGVLTRPLSQRGSTVVIFGNTAADPRSGASGYCTVIARELAKLGVSTFRFDFSGTGESEAQRCNDIHVYETSRVGDFRAAAIILAQHSYTDYVLAGVCSGGYHAVEAVLDDVVFKAAIVFNSWIIWHPGPLDVGAQASAMRSVEMRLTGTQHKFSKFCRQIFGRAEAMRKIALCWLHERGRGKIQQRLRAGARRGSRLHLVFGWRDRALDGFWSDFGPMGILFRRHKGCSARVVRGLDHSCLSRRSHAVAVREIHTFLLSLPPGL